MTVTLNHTIVHATNKHTSAAFVAGILDLPVRPQWGPFVPVDLANDVTLDYLDDNADFTPQHYAFLVSEADFDAAYGRLLDLRVSTWADPHRTRPGELNHNDGGRGVYFDDPDGHLLEILTRRYGTDPA